MKVERSCSPEMGFYVLLDVFWTWLHHRLTPQSGLEPELFIGVASQDQCTDSFLDTGVKLVPLWLYWVI